MSFHQMLAQGQLGESKIARWLRSRGNSVLPVYEKEIDTGKGPRFFVPNGQIVAPDMIVMSDAKPIKWVEAKHKSVFSWHRISRQWCTGIDLNHYQQYQQVQEISRLDVWVLFLHRERKPDQRDLSLGCPHECPVGLFGNSLSFLVRNENHRHDNWGRHGMVYWAADKLLLLAEIGEVEDSLGGNEWRASAV